MGEAMRRYLSLSVILLSFLSLPTFATEDSREFIVDNISVTQIDNNEQALAIENELWMKSMATVASIGEIIAIGEKLIAFGTKIWKIIENGKPSATIALAKPISVLPRSKSDDLAFYEMTGWSAPVVATYKFEAKNIYGSILASFEYTVAFQGEGSYGGVGQYVTGLQVNASSVYVKWGVTFNVDSELMTIMNRGTEDDPIAGATIKVNYSFSTAFSELRKSQSFHVTGAKEIVVY